MKRRVGVDIRMIVSDSFDGPFSTSATKQHRVCVCVCCQTKLVKRFMARKESDVFRDLSSSSDNRELNKNSNPFNYILQEARVETVKEGKHYVIPVPPSDMVQNLKGNESFRAHKSILAARSPIFRAMFFGLVGNPNMETVAIDEFDPFSFKAMLLFLYSDELPEVPELSDSDSLCTSTTILQHMLAAADRFRLARLRVMYEAKLCEEINSNTVATTLALAEQHQCLQLKTACLDFAAKPKNLGEVTKSDGFSYLEKCCPSLLIDLLKTSAAVDKSVVYYFAGKDCGLPKDFYVKSKGLSGHPIQVSSGQFAALEGELERKGLLFDL
ncbi:BTB/POZ and MATH domain-containing protein 3-like [Papaver somniferum]|uniref:BTB/POZ and MATH domain-containing protein 3-like n=1 Tax=Papaver somniferum TaxID=3469 RepID=UPI000E6F55B5|nr:BTB/POZ and MATH domain-containing protein 3-like [Papaver somniferum]